MPRRVSSISCVSSVHLPLLSPPVHLPLRPPVPLLARVVRHGHPPERVRVRVVLRRGWFVLPPAFRHGPRLVIRREKMSLGPPAPIVRARRFVRIRADGHDVRPHVPAHVRRRQKLVPVHTIASASPRRNHSATAPCTRRRPLRRRRRVFKRMRIESHRAERAQRLVRRGTISGSSVVKKTSTDAAAIPSPPPTPVRSRTRAPIATRTTTPAVVAPRP